MAACAESIAQQWQTVISGERILRLDEPKAVVDVMLGAISLAKGTCKNLLVHRDAFGWLQAHARWTSMEKT